ncbi:Hypothetical predicted protein [Olea europaea subsp. europaea]|uniref:Uncharacterized protein n=1 Tax=Olea europaea subsp. europaea TaxID=158383 RepID=A0A8S0ST57_OLEEU|nr:Hypothetical predicted protein [Olea europaea subsp. europaea]
MADLEKLLVEIAGRKRHSSPPSRRRRKVPLKKRLDPAERDNDRSSREVFDEDDDYDQERDSDDSVVSGLYKDEDDREKLSKLTELEQEMILEALQQREVTEI